MTETVTVNIRGVPADIRDRMSRAAAARGMTLAEYLTALVRLHDAMRALADEDWEQVEVELRSLGLQTIST